MKKGVFYETPCICSGLEKTAKSLRQHKFCNCTSQSSCSFQQNVQKEIAYLTKASDWIWQLSILYFAAKLCLFRNTLYIILIQPGGFEDCLQGQGQSLRTPSVSIGVLGYWSIGVLVYSSTRNSEQFARHKRGDLNGRSVGMLCCWHADSYHCLVQIYTPRTEK